MLVTKDLMAAIDFHNIFFPTMEVNFNQQLFGSSEYLLLWSTEERNSHNFGPTWGRMINEDNIFILGWTIPLRL